MFNFTVIAARTHVGLGRTSRIPESPYNPVRFDVTAHAGCYGSPSDGGTLVVQMSYVFTAVGWAAAHGAFSGREVALVAIPFGVA